MCIMSSFLQPFLMPSSLQNGLRIFINRYSLLTCISWREILPYYSQNAWSVLPKQWLMRSLIQSCPLDINQLLYEWQRGSPDEWQRSSLPEFLSSHLNTSFPGTLLVFNQSQLSFLPICELNEHHGGQMSSKWGRHFRTSPLHDQLSFNVHVLFISPINIRYLNGRYSWMITIFSWLFEIQSTSG